MEAEASCVSGEVKYVDAEDCICSFASGNAFEKLTVTMFLQGNWCKKSSKLICRQLLTIFFFVCLI